MTTPPEDVDALFDAPAPPSPAPSTPPGNPLMGAAPAQIAVHMRHDLLARRMWIFPQQNIGIKQYARRAVATLKRPMFDEGLLERMQIAPLGQPFNGHHLRAKWSPPPAARMAKARCRWFG